MDAKTAEAWAALRRERNLRLLLSDFTQLPDMPIPASTLAAWKKYRQELRDLPQNTKDPSDPAWPPEPSEGPRGYWP